MTTLPITNIDEHPVAILALFRSLRTKKLTFTDILTLPIRKVNMSELKSFYLNSFYFHWLYITKLSLTLLQQSFTNEAVYKYCFNGLLLVVYLHNLIIVTSEDKLVLFGNSKNGEQESDHRNEFVKWK